MTDYSWLKVYINQKIEKVNNRKSYLNSNIDVSYDQGQKEAYQNILNIIKQVEEA